MTPFWRPFLALLAIIAICPLSARAADTVLEPSDKWVLNYANDSCRLARAFGTDDEKVVLILDQYQPAGVMDLSLVGKRFKRFAVPRVPVSVTFGPGLPAGELRDGITGTLGPENTAIVMTGPRDILNRSTSRRAAGTFEEMQQSTAEQEEAITEAHIAVSSMRFSLHTGSMKAPLGAMRTCMASLVRDWGLDPAQQYALVRHVAPKGAPGNWLTSVDYPKGALAKGANAIVRFRLMVGADGMPSQCFVQQATMSPDFIKLTCDLLMKRARFSPALDAFSKPIASFYTNAVRWLTP
ncbi:energy transducer TonB [Novosphingobium fuchskuhlense]|uniref:energy transducer TonB n=1 Tax=Novosphingobium fuchskuhlense TaxID=1117702 RepID=UPI0009E957E6|nr:energy transducer TonB [Novosphingobium fuchskuhlense]